MTRRQLIDALITEHLLPRKCHRSRVACECGHIYAVHAADARLGRHAGRCLGKHSRGEKRGPCVCQRFTPLDYSIMPPAMNRYRRFADALLRAEDARRANRKGRRANQAAGASSSNPGK